MPWRNLRVPVELESTCGANLGWGRAEGGRKREKRKESLFHSTCVEQQRRSRVDGGERPGYIGICTAVQIQGFAPVQMATLLV